jgi:hypothetical protein
MSKGRVTKVGDFIDQPDSPSRPSEAVAIGTAVEVLDRRLSGDDTLDSLRENGEMRAWIEKAFGVTLADPIERMIDSMMRYEVTIVLSANSMGKTHAAARLALAWFHWMMQDSSIKDCEVFTAAAPPERNLKQLLWGEIYAGLNEAEDTFGNYGEYSLHVDGGPNSYVTGVTIPNAARDEQMQARFSGKHADALAFIFDEGDAIPQAVFDGAWSCMSGGKITRMLIMLNPRSPRGPVYRMVQNNEGNVVRLSAFDHPNVIQGDAVIPGAVSRDKVVRRIADWSRPIADGEEASERTTFELPDFLVGEVAERPDGSMTAPLPEGKRVVTNPNLCHMVLATYPKQGSHQLISEEWVDAAIERWKAYTGEYGEDIPQGATMGYDVASTGVDRNVLCFRKNNYVAPFNYYWSGVDPDTGASRAATAFSDHGCFAAKIDASGLGDGVPRKMRRQGATRAHGIKANQKPTERSDDGEFYLMRDQLAWKVREWLRPTEDEPSEAMLPPDEQLKEELTELTYGTTKRGKIRVMTKDKLREVLGRSPDKFDALALTFAPSKRNLKTANWHNESFEPAM